MVPAAPTVPFALPVGACHRSDAFEPPRDNGTVRLCPPRTYASVGGRYAEPPPWTEYARVSCTVWAIAAMNVAHPVAVPYSPATQTMPGSEGSRAAPK